MTIFDEATVEVDGQVDPAFESVADDDVDETPIEAESVELKPSGSFKRGECRVVGCLNPAKDRRSFYCLDHIQFAPSAGRVSPLARPRTESGQEVDPLGTRKKGMTRKIKKMILDHNEDIVKGGQFLAKIPEPWLDGKDGTGFVAEFGVQDPATGEVKKVTFWNTPLRKQLEVTDKQAEIIASAVTQFSMSEQGAQMQSLFNGIAPYITLIAAGGVVLMHSMKMNAIKAQVAELQGILKRYDEQQKAEQQGGIPQATEAPYEEERVA